jgi:hypothetical protein
LAARNIPAFVLTTVKSGHRTELSIPILPGLRAALASAPADHLTFIVTIYGAPRSPKVFTGWFKEAARAAGLPPDSSPHGLRKAACRRLAEAGCTPHEIMAITGHKALAEVETYTKAVRQKLLAHQAMGRLLSAFPGQFDPAAVANQSEPLAKPDPQSAENTGPNGETGGGDVRFRLTHYRPASSSTVGKA